jgi:hypothetical protein
MRLTLRDAILAKASLPPGELQVQSTNAATFTTNLTLNTVAGPVKFGSGWNPRT